MLILAIIRWPYFQKDPIHYRKVISNFYYFKIQGYDAPFGYLHSSFVASMPWPSEWALNYDEKIVEMTSASSFDERTKIIESTLRQGLGGAQALGKWCDERFPVVAADGERVMDMDGCGVDAFGVVNFGCHLLAYVKTEEGLKWWVPRRSMTKKTYPGMLDNTIGGSLSAGESPLDCIVREANEEASLPKEETRKRITSCGTLSYQMSQTDDGFPGCQHQVQYLYEMELMPDEILTSNDNEAEDFKLMSFSEVQARLAHGEFKLNCAMTWMACLIRHGIVNAENEPNLIEICARLHRKHDIFIV